MVDSHQVVLEVATPDRTEVLRNLLGLYMHDLSDSFPIKVGADGRFVYENLSLYSIVRAMGRARLRCQSRWPAFLVRRC